MNLTELIKQHFKLKKVFKNILIKFKGASFDDFKEIFILFFISTTCAFLEIKSISYRYASCVSNQFFVCFFMQIEGNAKKQKVLMRKICSSRNSRKFCFGVEKF